MKLTYPLCVLDIEATDPDPATCSIVEYGFKMIFPNGEVVEKTKRFKPWKPMTPKAAEVTGITDEMLAACPPFADHAEKIWKSLQNKDLAGYNLRRFDIPALDEEIRRATGNRLKLDISNVNVIDLFGIYTKKRPRKLEDCIRDYLGEEAYQEFQSVKHGAGADSTWTHRALIGAMQAHEDLGAMDPEQLAKYCIRDGDEGKTPIDIAGKLYRDAEGYAVYAFGKKRDVRVADDVGYAQWVLKCDDPPFPGSTRDALKAELARISKEQYEH